MHVHPKRQGIQSRGHQAFLGGDRSGRIGYSQDAPVVPSSPLSGIAGISTQPVPAGTDPHGCLSAPLNCAAIVSVLCLGRQGWGSPCLQRWSRLQCGRAEGQGAGTWALYLWQTMSGAQRRMAMQVRGVRQPMDRRKPPNCLLWAAGGCQHGLSPS